MAHQGSKDSFHSLHLVLLDECFLFKVIEIVNNFEEADFKGLLCDVLDHGKVL